MAKLFTINEDGLNEMTSKDIRFDFRGCSDLIVINVENLIIPPCCFEEENDEMEENYNDR